MQTEASWVVPMGGDGPGWLDEDDTELFHKFTNITRAHDQYRHESFAHTFPELHQAIQQSAS